MAPRNTTSRLRGVVVVNTADARFASRRHGASSPRQSRPCTTIGCAGRAGNAAGRASAMRRLRPSGGGSVIVPSSHNFVVLLKTWPSGEEEHGKHRITRRAREAAVSRRSCRQFPAPRRSCSTRATSSQKGAIDAAALRAVEDDAIRDIVKYQEDLGLHGITDGEFRRTYFHIDFLTKLSGVDDQGRHQRELPQRERQRRLRAAGDAGHREGAPRAADPARRLRVPEVGDHAARPR